MDGWIVADRKTMKLYGKSNVKFWIHTYLNLHPVSVGYIASKPKYIKYQLLPGPYMVVKIAT